MEILVYNSVGPEMQITHLISVATTVSVDVPGVSGRRWTVVMAMYAVGTTSRMRLSVVAGEEVKATRFLG